MRIQMTEVMTVKEFRAKLGVSNATAYRYIRNGDIESIKIGGLRRITQDAYEQFLQRHTVRGLGEQPTESPGVEQDPRKLARELGISLAEAKRRMVTP